MPAKERRRAARWRSRHELPSIRIRGGHDARAIDVASGGMLVETTLRLRPGSTIDLRVASGTGGSCLRGTIVRCNVSRLQAGRVFYQGAVQFDEDVAWLAGKSGGYPVLTGVHGPALGPGEDLPVR